MVLEKLDEESRNGAIDSLEVQKDGGNQSLDIERAGYLFSSRCHHRLLVGYIVKGVDSNESKNMLSRNHRMCDI